MHSSEFIFSTLLLFCSKIFAHGFLFCHKIVKNDKGKFLRFLIPLYGPLMFFCLFTIVDSCFPDTLFFLFIPLLHLLFCPLLLNALNHVILWQRRFFNIKKTVFILQVNLQKWRILRKKHFAIMMPTIF